MELTTEEYAARAAIPPPPDIAPVNAPRMPARPFAVLAGLIALMALCCVAFALAVGTGSS